MDEKKETLPFTEKDIKEYMDTCIVFWRDMVHYHEYAKYYVDAYQSMRTSLFGELLPSPE